MKFGIGTKLRLLAIAGCLLGLLLGAQPALAHPADMLFQYHLITLTQSGIDIEWSIYPGYLLVPRTWSEADADGDGQVTSQEATIWAQQRLSYLSAQVDSGGPIPLRITAVQWPSSLSTFQVGQEVITISLAGTLPHLAPGSQHTFSLHNQYQENNSIYGFDIRSDAFQIEDNRKTGGTFDAAFTAGAIQATPMELERTHSQTNAPGPVAEMLLSPPAQVDSKPSPEAASQTEVVKQSAVASLGSGSQLSPDTASQPAVILAGLVSSADLSPGFYLVALAVSLALGALHALTPGHGKTIVAAYLVGAKGTVKHAIALGGITTVTHTGSVLLLGIATLIASRYFIPTAFFPLLEVASGVLIAGLGLSLLWQRWRAWRSGDAEPSHPHGHSHSHPHSHDLAGHAHPDHEHSILYSQVGRHRPRGRLQIHVADDHAHDIPETITWRSLVGLGISGGLVPCPDAIAILLVAVAIHRIAFGLVLILAFSVGLALVLIKGFLKTKH
jgi:ABC-type nickel/cobalt efflux system permease component RcnA